MKHNRFDRRGTYKCDLCDRMTRDTGTGVDNICAYCYELCGYDNMINDNASDPMEYRKECDALLRKIEKRGGNVAKVVEHNSFVWPEGYVPAGAAKQKQKAYEGPMEQKKKTSRKTRRVRLTELQVNLLTKFISGMPKGKEADELKALITSAKIIAVRV